MYRFPDPLDEDSLKPLVADERYADSAHPEYPFYRKFVDRAFALVYPDPPRDGAGNFVIDPRDPPKPQVITGGAEFRPWENDDERDMARKSSSTSWQATPLLNLSDPSTAGGTGFALGRAGENDDGRSRDGQNDSARGSLVTVGPTTEQRAQHRPVEPGAEYRDAWRNLPATTPDTDRSLPSNPYARQREREAAGQDDGWPDAGARLPAASVRRDASPGESSPERNTYSDANAPDPGAVAARTFMPERWRLRPEFAHEIAKAESSVNKDGSYKWSADTGKSDWKERALGKYQLTGRALLDAGWMDKNGAWTEKANQFGIRSWGDFLAHHDAQEAAMRDVVRRNEVQAAAYGIVDRYAGRTYIGVNGEPITITATGIAAAMHRGGVGKVTAYLDRLYGAHGGTTYGKVDRLSDMDQAIETRLRTFQSTPYPRNTR